MTNQPDLAHALANVSDKYGLSYHTRILYEAAQQIDFKNKDVLEIGGCLPKEVTIDILGCNSWTGIVDEQYYHEIQNDFSYGDILDTAIVSKDGQYNVVESKVEDLHGKYSGDFDVIFSIATFEHLLNFPFSLDIMAQSLKKNGYLYSNFAPIWSSKRGHHVGEILDDNDGTLYLSSNEDFYPIPPWGHLLFTPPQMYKILQRHQNKENAQRTLYYIYHSNHINRLFAEDYLHFIDDSPLKGDVKLQYLQTFPEEGFQSALEAKQPGRQHFRHGGFELLLQHKSNF